MHHWKTVGHFFLSDVSCWLVRLNGAAWTGRVRKVQCQNRMTKLQAKGY